MALRVTGGVYERHRPNAGDKNDPHGKSNVAAFSNGFDQVSRFSNEAVKLWFCVPCAVMMVLFACFCDDC